MTDTNSKLHIEKAYSTCGMDTFLVYGLSVEETDRILNAAVFPCDDDEEKDRRSVLAEILDAHPNDYRGGEKIGTAWRCGYGIYSIRHFGGHLIVEVGNSCD